MVDTWNRHHIRPTQTSFSPSGRPSIMYSMPELYGTQNYICLYTDNDLAQCEEQYLFRDSIPCDGDVYQWCLITMAENNWSFPSSREDAVELYKRLWQMFLNWADISHLYQVYVHFRSCVVLRCFCQINVYLFLSTWLWYSSILSTS